MLTTERIDALLEEVRPQLPSYVRRMWGSHRLDWDGDPYVDVYIVIEDKVVRRFLKHIEEGNKIDRAIRDHFRQAGVEDFVLTTYRSASEQRSVAREEAAERRAALPRRRSPKQRKRA